MTGYLVPPIAWNIFVNYSGILTGANFAAVATNPVQGIYAITFMAILFVIIGPNSGLIGVPNLSGYQILMANLLSVPLIFLFTVPHLVITTRMIERYFAKNEIDDVPIIASLRRKIGVCTIYTFFGASFFVFIFNIAVVKSFDGNVDVGALVAKNLVVFAVSFLIAVFNFILLIRQVTAPINATSKSSRTFPRARAT